MICDLAETYKILNYKELPVNLVATLVSGLNENSRCKKLLEKRKVDVNTLLLAAIVDGINLLVWSKTKDALKGRNKPKSLVSTINYEAENRIDYKIYKTGKEFEKERYKLIEKFKKGEC